MLLDSKKVGDMTWQCAAIDHGVTFYENGKIAPCCLIAHTYRKDITEIHNQPFKDLKTFEPPVECKICVDAEANNISSYRQQFNKDVPILKPNASVLRTNSTKDSDPTSVPQKINSNKNKTQLLQKVSGVLWKPPAGSNNGSNKCWVNAPLYSILSTVSI